MSRKKTIAIIVLVILVIVGFYGYREYTRTNKDLSDARAEYSLTAPELLSEFEASDSVSAKKYNGRILEVTGRLKTVEKDQMGYTTLVLGDSSGLSSVRCSMDTSHHQDASGSEPGSSISVRGVCTGFNKDDLGLGSDVILNRCVIVRRKF